MHAVVGGGVGGGKEIVDLTTHGKEGWHPLSQRYLVSSLEGEGSLRKVHEEGVRSCEHVAGRGGTFLIQGRPLLAIFELF